MDSDSEISAAFGSGTAPTPAAVSAQDPEINEAFGDSARSDKRSSLADRYIGFQESQLHGLTGGIASLVGGLAYLGGKTEQFFGSHESDEDIENDKRDAEMALTYQPRTREGKKNASEMDEAASYLGPKEGSAAGDYVFDKTGSPLLAAAANTSVNAVPYVIGSKLPKGAGALRDIVQSEHEPVNLTDNAQEIVNLSAGSQSMGAAGAATQVSALPKSLQKAIVDAGRTNNGAVNMDALIAHKEAAEHGVQLMKGQATQDPEQFTEEQNSTHPDIVSRINAQESQLIDGLDEIRREASPTNVANSPRENGQVVLDDLKAFDKPRVESISAAYDAANQANMDAGKGSLKLDPTPGIKHAAEALEDREELLPSEGQQILAKMKAAADSGNGIPIKQAETWKTIVARATRKYDRAGDTNAVNALSDFRDSLEQMTPGNAASAEVQEKFNTARSLARQRFDDMDADPAYKAAALDTAKIGEPSSLADSFLDDYVLNKGAPKSQVDLMMSKLSEEGNGAIASHALSTIRNRAVGPNGKISPNGFNTAVRKYADKLDSLVSPETYDSLESFGRTLTRAKVEPPGGRVNYSRSGVLARDAMNHIAEGIVNAKTGGLYGNAKKILNLSENQFARDALKPGAGLDQLKPTAPPTQGTP